MSNALLIQQCSTAGYAYDMLGLTMTRHLQYCKLHDMDYWPIVGPVESTHMGGIIAEPFIPWAKIELLRRACVMGYEYVAWLDADTIILDLTADFRQACIGPVNMVRWNTPLPHLQAGVIYLHNTMYKGGGDNGAYMAMCRLLEEAKYYLQRYPTLRGWYEQGQINEFAEAKTVTGEPMNSDLYYPIDPRWNWGDLAGVECHNPVVLAWHGVEGQTRVEQMKQVLKDIERERENL